MFFGDVIVSCMTAGQPRSQGLSLPAPQRERDPGNEVDCRFGIQASNLKWRVCDVIVTSRHVIIDTP